ncbi:MAG: phosphate starvation-inducible protein PhoH [Candidatus Fluviicola riflensis]|nr:MAG: ribonuclease [Candidatus Fluviicola riflensis]OGS78110.1 MAG: phosphate starvation-inducible protein PhoH [Candidatus Fluviicola riflensis]OGS85176.1 MAG: phosphate starvation-inducible protein PhoH [Fluviicola sp. RIFCSPHIGHO2_01_FULL_43_53]OGS89447.1 MAG: phosphate starvation-inducible protein PhoH [Fluviicola sp. RIFCSPHIGHO2_12_FULL_43_24]
MSKKQKLFVLDTSVLLHDHHAIMHFERHDVAIPITVLEELDKFKIGNDTKNFSAREVIRFIDRISLTGGLQTWISLGKSMGSFKVLLNQSPTGIDAEEMYGSGKNDHKIINATLAIKEEDAKREVILVTKDINLRIKAKALGIHAEDYETGKVDDTDLRTSSTTTIEDVDSDVIKQLFLKGSIEESGVLGNLKVANGYYILKNGKSSSLTYFDPLTDTLHRVEKEYTSGIKPKNAEQAFAVNALMNNNIKLVALQGVAGTGKTLLALAAALEQQKQFQQIILARPLVPLSNKEIGFLPGDAKDKIGPYMEPLWDNLKFIKSQFGENEKKHKAIVEMEESGRILITPLAFIRGRSLSNILFIVDEAQNLTPHEVKTIITRAGEGTKIVFTGDVHQIDTPYLDENSNGLAYLIDRLKGQPLFSHIRLEKGERSDLANLANDLL